jgi:lysophospholipase L1-like esterase
VDRQFWVWMNSEEKSAKSYEATFQRLDNVVSQLTANMDHFENTTLIKKLNDHTLWDDLIDNRIDHDTLWEDLVTNEKQLIDKTNRVDEQVGHILAQLSDLQKYVGDISTRLPPPLIPIRTVRDQKDAMKAACGLTTELKRDIPGTESYSTVLKTDVSSSSMKSVEQRGFIDYKNLSIISDDSTIRNEPAKKQVLQPTKRNVAKNVLILSDSQLNKFDPEKFSTIFNSKVISAKKIQYLNDDDLLRRIRAMSELSAIVIQLGVNDLRQTEAKKVIKQLSSAMERIKQYCNIPILVCKLTPVLNEPKLQAEVVKFNSMLGMLESSAPHFRIINNNIFWRFSDKEIKELYQDRSYDYRGIHLNDRGVALLASNIKFGIARQFGIEIGRRERHDR